MNEQKKARLTFRVTEDERETIINESTEASMSFSEYVRSKIFVPEASWRRDKNIKEIMRSLIYEINRIGNNVNQVARSVNSKGFVTQKDLQEMKGCLKEVEKKSTEILDEIKK